MTIGQYTTYLTFVKRLGRLKEVESMRYRESTAHAVRSPRPYLLLVALVVTAVAASPAALATEPEIDPLELETLRDIRSVVLSVGAFEFDNGVVPGPTDGLVTAEFLRHHVEPTYIASLPVADGWGNALRYWSDGTRFIVASVGVDGVTDRPYAGVTAAELGDGGDDIVVIDGNVAAVPPYLWPVIRMGEQKATMADMRSLGTCVEVYKIDHGACPGPTPGQVDAAWMREMVEPVYIRTLPVTDAWGNPFVYWCDGEHYRIASLGLDGTQDMPFGEIEDGTATRQFTSDIVFEDGMFIQWPEGPQQ